MRVEGAVPLTSPVRSVHVIEGRSSLNNSSSARERMRGSEGGREVEDTDDECSDHGEAKRRCESIRTESECHVN